MSFSTSLELRQAVERIKKLEAALIGLLEFADRTGQGCAKQVEDARSVLAVNKITTKGPTDDHS